jgi:hypothetical protein
MGGGAKTVEGFNGARGLKNTSKTQFGFNGFLGFFNLAPLVLLRHAFDAQ